VIWILIAVLSLGSLALKAFGPLLAGGRTPPAALQRVITLLTPALITSLVVTGTLTHGQHLAVDARLAGLAAGLIALAARAPLAVALLVAAATAAGVRLNHLSRPAVPANRTLNDTRPAADAHQHPAIPMLHPMSRNVGNHADVYDR
jgi:hypothetical protein